jgi:hypothetical protein
VSDAVTTENAEDIILAQNPGLNLQEGDIQTTFTFKTKRNVKKIRRKLLQKKSNLSGRYATLMTVCRSADVSNAASKTIDIQNAGAKRPVPCVLENIN